MTPLSYNHLALSSIGNMMKKKYLNVLSIKSSLDHDKIRFREDQNPKKISLKTSSQYYNFFILKYIIPENAHTSIKSQLYYH